MEIPVINISGKSTSKKVKLLKEIFEIEPNDHAIYLDVKRYLASQHKGTHKTKTRSEVKGSTRKIKRQKGTGSARAGSIRNPLFKGGGKVFGPEPRDYSISLNNKVKQLARKSALSYKAKEGKIIVLEDVDMKEVKTKEYTNILKNLKLQDSKTLMVLKENKRNVYLSSRNIPKAKVATADLLNTYDILNAQHLLFEEGSMKKLEETFIGVTKDKSEKKKKAD